MTGPALLGSGWMTTAFALDAPAALFTWSMSTASV